ncbi:AAA-ATPase At3g28580-like [Zingiber officinale]|uniref:AAA-ATPase At3g28580-like n=1 Tax=Zingiber officinale TaxID=94328 RepID=UPI001C4C5978|nr:AAA-ATPase At3g28580-like [Zingiber officinale]
MAPGGIDEKWAAALWSLAASAMFLWPVVYRYFPGIQLFEYSLSKYSRRLVFLVFPYIHITFPEFSGERMKRSDAYAAIESYLAASCTQSATKLKAELGKDSSSLTLSMDEYEEVTDDFRGVRIWWTSVSRSPPQNSFSFYPQPDSRRYFRLVFHRRHRDLVVGSYLDHVLAAGREAAFRNRRRKLYTNNPTNNSFGYKKSVWSHVTFTHPSTFATLAMDPDKKREIVADLEAFRSGKDFYAKIGKPWKRGYLLHGPPGTGKSTMIAAIANYLDYDVYDLELTSVKDNTELRKLFIETTGKSIIVIEDIDCSLDLTGERKKKKKKDDKEEDGKEGDRKPPVKPHGDDEKQSKVTLSGLLNFIDGLWSACGGERLIIFTTNHVEKLDPALIRRGRMDKHIEMSYCCFEAFKVLAANYLGIVDGDHRLLEDVRVLLDEVKMTPADVAENLMPKSGDDAESCLRRLIQELEEAREKATVRVEEGNSTDGTAESEVVSN